MQPDQGGRTKAFQLLGRVHVAGRRVGSFTQNLHSLEDTGGSSPVWRMQCLQGRSSLSDACRAQMLQMTKLLEYISESSTMSKAMDEYDGESPIACACCKPHALRSYHTF